MNESEHPDHLSLTRLLQQAKPLMEPLFDDQKEKWAAESPMAQEIYAILVKHPEYYDESACPPRCNFSEPILGLWSMRRTTDIGGAPYN